MKRVTTYVALPPPRKQTMADGPKTRGDSNMTVSNEGRVNGGAVNGRIVGIVHRVKRKKDQAPRPTLVYISDQKLGTIEKHELATEQEELDFLNGRCPIAWRKCTPDEPCVDQKIEHQTIFCAAKEGDALVERQEWQCHYDVKKGTKKLVEVADKVPCHWIGLEHGDTVAMTLGGSGDYFAFALSRKLGDMQGQVIRIPPFMLDKHRGNASKDCDAELLVKLACEHRDEFYFTIAPDRQIIKLRNAYHYRMDVMKERIACEQRLFQRTRGDIFCNEEGLFPEGSLIKEFERRKASDVILQANLAEEAIAEKALKNAVEVLDVWNEVFADIDGIGYKIAARIISSVIDIRRFEKPSQLAAFLGVHVLKDGRFPRRRNGELANWHPDGRQALYLFADQLVRQKDRTKWGRYFLARKAALRVIHPVVEVDEKSKKKYTDGHIHKMAIWRTLTRFAEYLHREWWKLADAAAKGTDQKACKAA